MKIRKHKKMLSIILSIVMIFASVDLSSVTAIADSSVVTVIDEFESDTNLEEKYILEEDTAAEEGIVLVEENSQQVDDDYEIEDVLEAEIDREENISDVGAPPIYDFSLYYNQHDGKIYKDDSCTEEVPVELQEHYSSQKSEGSEEYDILKLNGLNFTTTKTSALSFCDSHYDSMATINLEISGKNHLAVNDDNDDYITVLSGSSGLIVHGTGKEDSLSLEMTAPNLTTEKQQKLLYTFGNLEIKNATLEMTADVNQKILALYTDTGKLVIDNADVITEVNNTGGDPDKISEAFLVKDLEITGNGMLSIESNECEMLIANSTGAFFPDEETKWYEKRTDTKNMSVDNLKVTHEGFKIISGENAGKSPQKVVFTAPRIKIQPEEANGYQVTIRDGYTNADYQWYEVFYSKSAALTETDFRLHPGSWSWDDTELTSGNYGPVNKIELHAPVEVYAYIVEFISEIPNDLIWNKGTAYKLNEKEYMVFPKKGQSYNSLELSSMASDFTVKFYEFVPGEEKLVEGQNTDTLINPAVGIYYCKMDVDSIVAKTNWVYVSHRHNFKYVTKKTVSDNDTLVAYCNAANCFYPAINEETGYTLTLSSSDDSYTGNIFTEQASFADATEIATWKQMVSNTLPVITYQYKEKETDSYADVTEVKQVGFYKALAIVGTGDDKATAESKFKISPKEITEVAFTNPVVTPGKTVSSNGDLAIADETNYTGAINWQPADDKYKYNKEYSAVVTLSAKPNYIFGATVTYPAGWTKDTEESTDTELVLTRSFAITAKAKIISVSAPNVTSPLETFTTKDAQLEKLPAAVNVEVEDNSVSSMKIIWTLKAQTTYSTEPEAENIFEWVILPSEYENYDTNGKTLSGNVIIQNPVHEHTWIFTAKASTLMATCAKGGTEGCTYDEIHALTLTLSSNAALFEKGIATWKTTEEIKITAGSNEQQTAWKNVFGEDSIPAVIIYEDQDLTKKTNEGAGTLPKTEGEYYAAIIKENAKASLNFCIISEDNRIPVTFSPNGGRLISGQNVVKVEMGSTLEEPELKVVKDNLIFEGWYVDKETQQPWDFENTKITEPVTIYAGWGYPAGEEDIAEMSVARVSDFYYTGSKIMPSVVVTFGDKVLIQNVDYTVSYKNNVNVCTGIKDNNLTILSDGSIDYSKVDEKKCPTIFIKGKGNYSKNRVSLNFNILPLSLGEKDTLNESKEVVADIICNYTYNEKATIAVKPVIRYGKKKLTNKKQYDMVLAAVEAKYENGQIIPTGTTFDKYKLPKGVSGTFKLTITGKGNYTGGFYRIINISKDKYTLQKAKVTVKKLNATGKDFTVEDLINPAIGKLTVKVGSKTLTYGVDYTISFQEGYMTEGSRKCGGVYPILITGTGNYVGTRNSFVVVNGVSLKKAKVELENTNVVYDGKHHGANIKAITVAVYENGNTVDKKLVAGVDYTVKVINDVKAGKASVTITGKGIYTGTKKITYVIQKKEITKDMFVSGKINADSIDLGEYAYFGGCAVQADPNISYNGVKLINPSDYKVKYSKNKASGSTATAVVSGTGNYTGKITCTFKIGPDTISPDKKSIAKASGKIATKIYTGEAITLENRDFENLTVKVKENGKTVKKNLILGKDFEIVEGSYVRNTNVTSGAKAQVTIKGINEYDGYCTLSFKIAKKDLKWWKIIK